MAQQQYSNIGQALTSVLPRPRIRRLAVRYFAVRRRRKVDIAAFIYCLVLGFDAGKRRTLTGIRRSYQLTTGVRLAPSSFYQRFNSGLARLMQHLVQEAMDRLADSRPKLRDVFRPFREVLVADSSLIGLHEVLKDAYPSVWTNHTKASAKLAVVINAMGRSTKSIKVAHGSCHDTHMLKAGKWMKGRLLIFDLGYFQVAMFNEIVRQSGFFLSRMRQQGNPVITQSHQPVHSHLVGRKLLDVLDDVDEDIIDVEAEMGYMLKRSPYTHYTARFRFVAIYNCELGVWHRYVTNLPTGIMKAQHLAAVYACRWEVELLFRELKNLYRIDDMPSGNLNITQCLIYAALLTLAVSRKLHKQLTNLWRLDRRRAPFDRWAVLITNIAGNLLVIGLSRRGNSSLEKKLQMFLKSEAPDPNRSRIPLAYRAQQGIYRPA
jgi:putative transposase